jgi:hypothetical protein
VKPRRHKDQIVFKAGTHVSLLALSDRAVSWRRLDPEDVRFRGHTKQVDEPVLGISRQVLLQSTAGTDAVAVTHGQGLTLRNESSGRFAGAFFRPPLYSLAYDRGFGTLYTAVYVPRTGLAEYRWPGTVWRFSVDSFTERSHVVHFSAGNPDSEKRAGPIPQ